MAEKRIWHYSYQMQCKVVFQENTIANNGLLILLIFPLKTSTGVKSTNRADCDIKRYHAVLLAHNIGMNLCFDG